MAGRPEASGPGMAGHGAIDTLILQALVRKLVDKNLLSRDDVLDLLFEAARRLDVVGGELTPQAARSIVEEDLAPAYLGKPGAAGGT